MKIEIINGRLVDHEHGLDRVGALYVAAGRIVAVDAKPAAWNANRVIDAKGQVVAPGFVDLAARLREPGFEYKATLESELRAAVADGQQSVILPQVTFGIAVRMAVMSIIAGNSA